MQAKILNRVVIASISGLVVFFALYAVLSHRQMLIIMNGLFFGSMVGVAVTYGQLLWAAITDRLPDVRVRQMAIGMAAHWVATSLLIGSSVVLVSVDAGERTTIFGLLGRYLAIVAAALKVTAPDYGLGLFHGRDRKLWVAGLFCGGLAAVIVIFLQEYS